MFEIIQRFAHAHHDDIGDLAIARWHHGANRDFPVREIAETITRQQQLRQDFLRSQIAHKLLRAGMTEGTGQRAADLA